MKVTNLPLPKEEPVVSVLLDIVRNSKLYTDSSGEPPAKFTNTDYVSHSYLSMIKRCLLGQNQFFGNEKYLVFGHELHKRWLKPNEPKKKLTKDEEKLLKRMIATLNKDKELISFRDAKDAKVEQVTVKPVWYGGWHAKVILDMKRRKKAKDLKTTSAKTQKEFFKACIEYGYFGQAALYMEAEDVNEFELVGVSKKVDEIFKIQVTDYPDLLEEGIEREMALTQVHYAIKEFINVIEKKAA